MKNCAMFQKRIALHETMYCFQSSEALGGFWSFLKLYMYIQIETFMYAITSHKKRRAKYQTEMLSWIAKQQFRYKQCFQRNNTMTVDTDDQKFNCDNANGHSQTGNRKKMSASWIGLITVFGAILTGRQAGVKLQCLYENPMSNNLRKTSVWKKI